MPTERLDPDALLCRRCGYPLDAVLHEFACPECGTPIASSMPEMRVGSPWQRGGSFASWLRTLAALARWRQLFDTITIGKHDAEWLLRINLGLAALLTACAFAEDRIDEVLLHSRGSLAGLLGALLILTPAAYAVLRGLTAIERAGLQFFGNKRGGRVTPGIARAVTAHASYGWMLAGLLAVILAFLGHSVFRTWYGSLGTWWVLRLVPAHTAFAAGGFFAGLIVFETLSYLGTLRCRFANLPRPHAESTNESGANAEPSVDNNEQQPPSDSSSDDVSPQADAAHPSRQ
ncbi:MAG: zinc ribbon domain-containing protein [Planctomycetota bacterium]